MSDLVRQAIGLKWDCRSNRGRWDSWYSGGPGHHIWPAGLLYSYMSKRPQFFFTQQNQASMVVSASKGKLYKIRTNDRIVKGISCKNLCKSMQLWRIIQSVGLGVKCYFFRKLATLDPHIPVTTIQGDKVTLEVILSLSDRKDEVTLFFAVEYKNGQYAIH